jgi:hypothetical protein
MARPRKAPRKTDAGQMPLAVAALAASSPPASALNPLRRIGDSFDHHGHVWTLTAYRNGAGENGADEVEFRCPDYSDTWRADPEVLRRWAKIHVRISRPEETA